MKKRLNSLMLLFVITATIPLLLMSQHRELKVMVQEGENDSITQDGFFTTIIDVVDLDKMHQQLDSIFMQLDGRFQKRIKVMAFNRDSVFKDFDFQFDFDGDLDSIFEMSKLSSNDKRIDALLKSHQMEPGKQVWVFKDKDGKGHEGVDVEVLRDSVTQDGRTVIKKRIIVKSKEGEDGESVIIKEFNEEDLSGQGDVIAYRSKNAVRYPGKNIQVEKGEKFVKHSDKNAGSSKVVDQIKLEDAELLERAGLSPGLITAPALRPARVEVQVKIKEEFGNEKKTVGMSLDFDDVENTQVYILDKDGHILFEEQKKKFSGKYQKDIEMNNALSPYYFIVVRGKNMFGRILLD